MRRILLAAMLPIFAWGCGETPAPHGAGERLPIAPACTTDLPCHLPHVDRFSGACAAQPAPDGAPCEGGTDRAGGVCQAGICAPTESLTTCETACSSGCWPGSRTAPPWIYRPASDETRLGYAGVMDEEGNLFWQEEDPAGGCSLVSMTWGGRERFRVDISCPIHTRASLSRGRLLVFMDEAGVTARSTRDGSERWALEPPAVEGCRRVPVAMAASEETLFVVLSDRCSNTSRTTYRELLWGVSLPAGIPRFLYDPGAAYTEHRASDAAVIADSEGNAFARFAHGVGEVLFGLEPDGTVRWLTVKESSGSHSWPVATWGDRVYLFWYSGIDSWGTSALRGSDGEPLPTFEKRIGGGFVIQDDHRVWSVSRDQRTHRSMVTLFEDNRVSWEVEACALGLCQPSQSPILTAEGSLLLASADSLAILSPSSRSQAMGGCGEAASSRARGGSRVPFSSTRATSSRRWSKRGRARS